MQKKIQMENFFFFAYTSAAHVLNVLTPPSRSSRRLSCDMVNNSSSFSEIFLIFPSKPLAFSSSNPVNTIVEADSNVASDERRKDNGSIKSPWALVIGWRGRLLSLLLLLDEAKGQSMSASVVEAMSKSLLWLTDG